MSCILDDIDPIEAGFSEEDFEAAGDPDPDLGELSQSEVEEIITSLSSAGDLEYAHYIASMSGVPA